MRTLLVSLSVAALLASGCGKKDKDNAKKDDKSKKDDKANQKTKDKNDDKATKDDKTTKDDKAKPDTAALVKRGEYLANITGCAVCHTSMGPEGMGAPWAGGLEVPEKGLGTWRSPNITQDKKTGIGGWTDEEIMTTVRTGKRPDGTQLSVMMPYMMYNVMSDDDAKALVAFLRTIDGVEKEVKPSELIDKLKVPAPPPAGKAPSKDEQGAYLATLMHCPMCHTPMDENLAPDMSKPYGGGFKFELPPFMGTGDLYAPNITPHETGIADWTEQDIQNSFRKFVKKDGKPIGMPMVMYAQGWAAITDDDAAALAGFIKNLKPVDNKVPESTFKPAGPPPGKKP